MTQAEIRADRAEKLNKRSYCRHYWRGWNYSTLSLIWHGARRIKKEWVTFSDAIIMCDTETSKERINEIDENGKYVPVENYVVAWSIAIRAYHHNIVTLWGNRPSEFCDCLEKIRDNLKADNIILFWHNMAYDWTFMRKFLMKELGFPDKQLNVKSHYPIVIGWENAGIIMKDSLVLAQRSLEKWASDLKVEHQKAVGSWDYLKIRSQHEEYDENELLYIENDVLAGVECIDKTAELLNKEVYLLPFTATGIPRADIQKIASGNKGHQLFEKLQSPYYVYKMLDSYIFHGGYVHANRHLLNVTLTKEILGYDTEAEDFASSYPFNVLVQGFPASKFVPLENCTADEILAKAKDYCFIFKLIMVRPRLKDYQFPMPPMQFSKAVKVINPICDNGRILGADYCEIYLTEIDLEVIREYYDWDAHICTEVHYAEKALLPKWFRDYIFNLFKDKSELNGVDDILYILSKYKLNAAAFGMSVQKYIKPEITEDYETGEFNAMDEWDEEKQETEYAKHIKKRTSVLNFATGVYITAYAMRNLFRLGKCCEIWIYSDTDSVYGAGWDKEKLAAYNESCKEQLRAAGYGPVIVNGREFWLGVAEHDGLKDTYSEFRTQGAKRYAGRCMKDGKIHITVAGVPKRGADQLKDDLDNFKPGFIFKGEQTGKKSHTYILKEDIEIKNGIEYGDSIDLNPCDYELDGVVDIPTWEDLLHESVDLPTYGNEFIYDEGGGTIDL